MDIFGLYLSRRFSVAASTSPCNTAIGGPANSKLVHEVDALGGEIGKISERFQIICARLLPKPQQPLPHPSLLHLQPLLLILRCCLNLSRSYMLLWSASRQFYLLHSPSKGNIAQIGELVTFSYK
ncbi:glucose-inhibited division family A protein, partial [Prunus dulcis]